MYALNEGTHYLQVIITIAYLGLKFEIELATSK